MKASLRAWPRCAIHLGVLLYAAGGMIASGRAAVVNIDFEAGVPSDTNHVGDDGALSTPGGTHWNSVVAGMNTDNLLDEFGVLTALDVSFFAPGSGDGLGNNNLQDSGTGSRFLVVDLVPGQLYDIAAYVALNSGFTVVDDTGPSSFFGLGNPGADGWSLPGTEGPGGDFFRVTSRLPFDVGGGVFGLEVRPDGMVTGFQITETVPEPAAALPGLMATLALLGTLRGRRDSSRRVRD